VIQPASTMAAKANTATALRVWRYELPKKKNEAFWISMPKGAVIFYAGRVNEAAYLWALVNPGMPEENRYFYVAQDNFPLPSPGAVENYTIESLSHVGTYVGFGQALHVIELVGCRPIAAAAREPGDEG
jgi:hypothetical protein